MCHSKKVPEIDLRIVVMIGMKITCRTEISVRLLAFNISSSLPFVFFCKSKNSACVTYRLHFWSYFLSLFLPSGLFRIRLPVFAIPIICLLLQILHFKKRSIFCSRYSPFVAPKTDLEKHFLACRSPSVSLETSRCKSANKKITKTNSAGHFREPRMMTHG